LIACISVPPFHIAGAIIAEKQEEMWILVCSVIFGASSVCPVKTWNRRFAEFKHEQKETSPTAMDRQGEVLKIGKRIYLLYSFRMGKHM
jgi:hypothetical protein